MIIYDNAAKIVWIFLKQTTEIKYFNINIQITTHYSIRKKNALDFNSLYIN